MQVEEIIFSQGDLEDNLPKAEHEEAVAGVSYISQPRKVTKALEHIVDCQSVRWALPSTDL